MTDTTSDIPVATDRPDTREMLMVHRVFRRDLAAAPALITAVATGDVARAQLLADHLRLVILILDVHHSGEDELIWPLLLERVPADAVLVNTMESQHAAVAGGIRSAREQLDQWATTADPAQGERLAATITELMGALLVHLDAEEAQILPLIETHLSVEEWARLGQHGMGAVTDEKRPIVLGMLTEDLPADQLASFLSHLPPPVRQLWETTWAPAYAGYVTAVRGTPA